MKKIIARIGPIAMVLVLMLMFRPGYAMGELPTAEIQEAIEELGGDAKDLKKLIRRMNRPAHKVPGEAGAEIHGQFHRCEGWVLSINHSVKTLKKLAADPEKNKEQMRQLVVVELWDQLGSEMFGGLAKAVSGMSGFIEQALTADPEDANALKCQDILYKMEDAQYDLVEQVKELGAKVQDPIVWEYSCMTPLNASRLANGNTLINEVFGERVIEVTPDGEVVWEYSEDIAPTDSERLENGNTLIADRDEGVIEVTPDKEIVWEYSGLDGVFCVQRLTNGDTLIVAQGSMKDPGSRGRVIEVTSDKEIVWEYSGPAMEFLAPSGKRLANGNTLIGDNTGFMEGIDVHVREITPDKEIVWEYSKGLTSVYPVLGLANGNTLICAQADGRIIEVTPDKNIVWMYSAIGTPGGMQRLANGNTLIAVFGENRVIEVASPAAPALDVETIKEAVEELDEHAHELIEITTAVHDNTEEIADDEGLKDDLRAMAEEIHVASHELGHIAEHIHEHVDELEHLAADPEANKAEIKEALDEIVEHLGEYSGVLEAKHDLVHKVLFKTPDSHKEYADATHDAVHEAEGIVEHMLEHAQELAGLVN